MTCEEYDKIHALRHIEFVGHELEDWRAACVAAVIASAMAKEPPSVADVLKLIQSDRDADKTVSPNEGAAMMGGQRGELRKSGSTAGAGQTPV